MKADGLWATEQGGRGPARSRDNEAPKREGAAIRTVRVRGKAEAIIPAYAQRVGARAIVVERTYGTPRIWRSAAVVSLSRSSPVPVLVLPTQAHAVDRAALGDINRVVVGVDSSVASAVALRTGMGLARRHYARLTMLHALKNVPEHMVFSGSEAWRVMQRLPAQERQMAGHLRQRAALLGDSNAQAQVVTGDLSSAIVLGSTLRTVLRRARTPVLVVPVIGGAEQWYEGTFGEDAIRAFAEPLAA